MLSMTTAMDIALVHREIDTAEKLLAQVEEQIDKRPFTDDIRDHFGRVQNGLQLGVPSGDKAQRLFNVPWTLAKPVIEAHIANQRARLSVLSEKARIELCGGGVE